MALLLLLFCIFALAAEEWDVFLSNPTYAEGTLYTEDGGVIINDHLRIQARSIAYCHKPNEGMQYIDASGDLMIQWENQIFVGQRLVFDFLENTGTLFNGRTTASLWYTGGNAISLMPDGSFCIKDAFLTACENRDFTWNIQAKQVQVVPEDCMAVNHVRLCFEGKPLLWLPSFSWSLKTYKMPLFDYYVTWNKGPKVGLRYQVCSWHDFDLYGRLEYRWKKGWGGAIETEYFPDNIPLNFVTRSYAGTDRLFNALDATFRYRLQGNLQATPTPKTQVLVTWDKYSDVRMPSDFKSDDFEVDTAMRTILFVRHQEPHAISFLKVRPRANSFESIKQDLPTVSISTKPISIKDTGIISTSLMKASYLDFAYSDQLVTSLSDFHSPRIELRENLYRPFHWGKITFSPFIDGRAIFYGTSPSHKSKTAAMLGYGAKANMIGKKQYDLCIHSIEPYLQYQALTRPTTGPDEHFIFSIQDGYDKIQQVEIGVRNHFSICNGSSFVAHGFVNAFFSDPAFHQVVPRAYLFLEWSLPHLFCSSYNAYNFRNKVMDFSNWRLQWTVSDDFALAAEARYRSSFDYRKANHDNFILDVTRSESELILSPLSDRRITLLAKCFIRLNPFWEVQIESHHGFYRKDEKPYNEFEIHLFRTISTAWKLHAFYSYTVDNHFGWGIKFMLLKKGF